MVDAIEQRLRKRVEFWQQARTVVFTVGFVGLGISLFTRLYDPAYYVGFPLIVIAFVAYVVVYVQLPEALHDLEAFHDADDDEDWPDEPPDEPDDYEDR